MIELGNQTIELFKQTADVIEQYGIKALAIGIKQAWVSAITSIVDGVIFSIIAYCLYITYKKAQEKYKDDDSFTKELIMFSLGAFLILTILFAILGIIFGIEGFIQVIINPEYAGIQQILKLIPTQS